MGDRKAAETEAARSRLLVPESLAPTLIDTESEDSRYRYEVWISDPDVDVGEMEIMDHARLEGIP